MARISFQDEDVSPLCINCLQLRATSETFRLAELKQIEQTCQTAANEGQGQLWVGDLNSLRLRDYDSKTLKEITAERKKQRAEAPRSLVTDRMRSIGLSDAREVAEDVNGSVATFKDGTRMDYVFIDDKCRERWKVQSLEHVETRASTHKLVAVVLESIM